MSLTRLKNIITSRTGRIIYVNPDDFDASDAIDNRGNSALRPFKSLQRAFLEVARFSYRVGLSNDEFDAFSIMLYPAEYQIDNRPGDVLYTSTPMILMRQIVLTIEVTQRYVHSRRCNVRF